MAKRKKPDKSLPRITQGKVLARSPTAPAPQPGFDEVLAMIDAARARAVAAVNTALIDLYWKIGDHILQRIAVDGWGQGTVRALAEYIRTRYPGMSGYSAQNLWRMRQFVRDLPPPATTLTTGERIVLEPQPADHGQVQTGRRARVLPPPLPARDAGQARTGAPA